MKDGIHPEYKEATITCACGAKFKTFSIEENLRVEVCSNCHPFYTGKQKFENTGGRIDRFKRRFGLDKVQEVEIKTESKPEVEIKIESKSENKVKEKNKKPKSANKDDKKNDMKDKTGQD